jgi:predicted phosphodiesterase
MKKIHIVLLMAFTLSYAGQIETPIRFAVIGDRTGSAQHDIYEQVVSEIKALKPDFVLTVGDMIQGYTEDSLQIKHEWDEYLAIAAAFSMPIYYTPGNHDITTDAILPFYERYIGKPYYSFNIKSVHFISLDVSRYESSSQIPEQQLEWLIKDLNKNKKARHIVVFYHKPFWFDEVLESKPDTLHSIFRNFGVDAVFNGHFHNYFSQKIDNILYTALGSSGGDVDPGLTGIQFHYTWVTIDKDGITITPIKKNSVFAWDEVTAQQVKTVDKIAASGITFKNSISLDENMELNDSVISVKIVNITDFPTDDTIIWESKDNWLVIPQSLPLLVSAKDSFQALFKVKNKGEVYPAPVISVDFQYAQDKYQKFENYLPVSRTVLCHKVNRPVIDGKLSETFWGNPVMKLFAPDGGTARIDSTRFYFAYDTDNLYLGAMCRELKTDEIVANVTEPDGTVYGEDCVGYFFVPDCNTDTIYQIYFNPNGVVFDQKISNNGYYADREWNSISEVKTVNGKDYWSLEARIPLEQFKVKAKTGDKWGINFRRKQKRLNSSADWQVPIQYDSKTFGKLIMK